MTSPNKRPANPSHTSDKLDGYDFYRNVLKSPKYMVAPMVDQSELAWRILSRRYGAQVVYTPMINAKMYSLPSNTTYRSSAFDLTSKEEGSDPADRPLIIQFCANDPEKLLTSAKMLEAHCDAVDINLGCPQDIAKKGKYGAFLMQDWDLIYSLINTLHKNLSVPVTAKFRIFPEVEKTVEYAKMLERAGAQILTCHGRTREQRGQNSGLADWAQIRAVKAAVTVPVFANGNILYFSDIDRCLEETGADAIMCAEGNLYNPCLFAPSVDLPEFVMHTKIASEYLAIVKDLKTRTSPSAIKGHLFKLLRSALPRETDLRDRLGRVSGRDLKKVLEEYTAIVDELHERMLRDIEAAGEVDWEQTREDGLRVLPHWVTQPYVRPLPKPVEAAAQEATIVPAKRPLSPQEAGDDPKKAKIEADVGVVLVVA